jgi:hypothetical protein
VRHGEGVALVEVEVTPTLLDADHELYGEHDTLVGPLPCGLFTLPLPRTAEAWSLASASSPLSTFSLGGYMAQEISDAIRDVVAYLWADEEADYEQQDSDGRKNHIFHSLVVLDSYVMNREDR